MGYRNECLNTLCNIYVKHMLPARKIQISFGESMPTCILNANPRTPTEDIENNRRLNQSSFLSVITSRNHGCYSCQDCIRNV